MALAPTKKASTIEEILKANLKQTGFKNWWIC
jgi:hypothetical protein